MWPKGWSFFHKQGFRTIFQLIVTFFFKNRAVGIASFDRRSRARVCEKPTIELKLENKENGGDEKGRWRFDLNENRRRQSSRVFKRSDRNFISECRRRFLRRAENFLCSQFNRPQVLVQLQICTRVLPTFTQRNPHSGKYQFIPLRRMIFRYKNSVKLLGQPLILMRIAKIQ